MGYLEEEAERQYRLLKERYEIDGLVKPSKSLAMRMAKDRERIIQSLSDHPSTLCCDRGQYRYVKIHDGTSIRADCSQCGSFHHFELWNPVGAKFT